VFVDGQPPLGEMVTVRIDGAMTYDLTGTVDAGAAQVIGIDE
jgi:hypothetical protein